MKTRSYRMPGLHVTDCTLEVPLDHAAPAGEQITISARVATAARHRSDDLPFLLWLQGGPGYKAHHPSSGNTWQGRALERYRVVLLDQRGTGRSSPVSRQTLPARGNAAAQAEYLRHFRADSIVRDAECLRRALVPDEGTWSVLGESYGGWCGLTYLSFAPEGLREVLISAGLASLTEGPDAVYRAAYRRVLSKNEKFFARYPGDRETARRIADHLLSRDIRLPNGERLTARRFQTLGSLFGKAGYFDAVHFIVDEAFVDGTDRLGDGFLHDVYNMVSHSYRPMYALMHESIYCHGVAADWSAERVRAEFPEFDVAADVPFAFTGEMTYPWFFDEDDALVPLKEAADTLAKYPDWPALFDLRQLAVNEVPVAAVVYHDDLFVDVHQSLDTAARVKNLSCWVTNEYEHDGLDSSPRVFDRLVGMATGEI